jgi:hypothetical protein
LKLAEEKWEKERKEKEEKDDREKKRQEELKNNNKPPENRKSVFAKFIWGNPAGCSKEDKCGFCHTENEYDFHPKVRFHTFPTILRCSCMPF